MKKYFPDLFNKYFNISGIIENEEVVKLFIEYFYREPNLDETKLSELSLTKWKYGIWLK